MEEIVIRPDGTIEPAGKAPAVTQMLESMTGVKRTDNVCVSCKTANVLAADFRDDLSRREFSISRLCQSCQDRIFGDDDE